jgi:hypothetical protein
LWGDADTLVFVLMQSTGATGGRAAMRLLFALAVVAAVAVSSAVGAGAATGRDTTASVISVTITDQSLRVSPIVPGSGPTTFVVRNRGRKVHTLAVAGPGLKNAKTAGIAAGRTAKLSIELRPGTYRLFDPVGLGAFAVQYITVTRATTLTGTGTTNVPDPSASTPGMCGVYGASP